MPRDQGNQTKAIEYRQQPNEANWFFQNKRVEVLLLTSVAMLPAQRSSIGTYNQEKAAIGSQGLSCKDRYKNANSTKRVP